MIGRLFESQDESGHCFDFYRAHLSKLGRDDEPGGGARQEGTEVAVELLCRMGRLCESHTKNLEGAARCYERALTFDSESRDALAGLRRAYEGLNEPKKLVRFLETQECAAQAEERSALALKRGMILQDALGDLDGATAAFEAALDAAPRHLEAAQALAETLTRGGGRDRLPKSVSILVGVLTKTRPADGHLTLYTIGSLCESQGERQSAIEAYEGATG